MLKIAITLFGVLGLQTVAMAQDFEIVRFGWLQCESEDDLHLYADAKDEKAIWKLMADHLDKPKCISNLSTFRIEKIAARKTPKGNPYLCFSVDDIVTDSQYQACTPPVFISSIVKEINTRTGMYEIVEERAEGVMARCQEGGTVRVYLRNGVPERRESRVFSNLFLDQPPLVNVSGPLYRLLIDGCRGVDFQKKLMAER